MEHIVTEIERVESEVVERFRSISAATVYEANDQRGLLGAEIKPISRGMRVCGPAVTVSCPADDNLMLHVVVTVAQAGDVVVASTGGYRHCAFFGDILAAAAQVRGITGLVIDGCVRDGAEIAELGFPVFAFGLNMRSPHKEKVGAINYPVIISGTVVRPGDLVVGGDDGVVVVRREDARSVLEKAKQREEKERRVVELLHQGRTTLEVLGLSFPPD